MPFVEKIIMSSCRKKRISAELRSEKPISTQKKTISPPPPSFKLNGCSVRKTMKYLELILLLLKRH